MFYKSSITGLLILGFASAVSAAGSESSSAPTPKPPSNYTRAVQAVNSGEYRRAVSLLDKVIKAQPRNADAWNYLGFSHRQMNEYEQALAAYEKALAIDPEHRGANEYLGELYLKMGKIEKARERLKVLDDACFLGCDEYDELKAAIRSYESG